METFLWLVFLLCFALPIAFITLVALWAISPMAVIIPAVFIFLLIVAKN